MQMIRVLTLLVAALSLPVSGFGQVLHACAAMEAVTEAHACCPDSEAERHAEALAHDDACCDTLLVQDAEPAPVPGPPELPSLVALAPSSAPMIPTIDRQPVREITGPNLARGPPRGTPPPVYLTTCSFLI